MLPRNFDSVGDHFDNIVGTAAFHFPLRGKDHSVSQNRGQYFFYILRNYKIPAFYGCHCFGRIHHGNRSSWRSSQVQVRVTAGSGDNFGYVFQ